MDLHKEREAFEAATNIYHCIYNADLNYYFSGSKFVGDKAETQVNAGWKAWQVAKAQAVQEQDQQVWATSNLTWKGIAFRALSCKVLKSTENWVHVKNIACVGSTTASLICKKLGVDPDGTKFEMIEAREPDHD